MEIIVDNMSDGKRFSFKAEPSFLEQRKIRQEMSLLAGSMERLEELESMVDAKREKYVLSNFETYGKEEVKRMSERYSELIKEEKSESEEYKEILERMFGSREYREYAKVNQELEFLKNVAYMKVMCLEPVGFDFYNQQEPYLYEIWGRLEEKRIFFRRQTKTS